MHKLEASNGPEHAFSTFSRAAALSVAMSTPQVIAPFISVRLIRLPWLCALPRRIQRAQQQAGVAPAQPNMPSQPSHSTSRAGLRPPLPAGAALPPLPPDQPPLPPPDEPAPLPPGAGGYLNCKVAEHWSKTCQPGLACMGMGSSSSGLHHVQAFSSQLVHWMRFACNLYTQMRCIFCKACWRGLPLGDEWGE